MDSFYRQLADAYDRIFPLKEEVIRFVAHFVSPEEGKILDVGCATGQLSIALAKSGYKVRAFDQDEKMIRLAKTKRSGSDYPEFFIADMQDLLSLAIPEGFAAVLCLGNTMPHMSDFRACKTFIQSAYEILTPGGHLMIQIVNFFQCKAGYVFPVIEKENLRFERWYTENENNPHRIDFHTRLRTSNADYKNTITLLPITRTQIEEWLKESGFIQLTFYGNYLKIPFQKDSPALIVCARKR